MKQKKVALALGSGGIRGFAHIGVIETLLAHNIPIDAIVGSSAGALIGGLYVACDNISDVKIFISSISYRELVSLAADFTWSTGIIRGEKFHKFLEQRLGPITIESLKIPYIAVATDIQSGAVVAIDHGSLTSAIIASCTVPSLISATPYHDMLLVDGGLSDPVPADIAKTLDMDIVIGVNLDAGFFPLKSNSLSNQKYNPVSTGITSIDLVRYHLGKCTALRSDVVIEPCVPKTTIVEIHQGSQFIIEGNKAAELAIPTIKSLLEA